MEELMRKSLKTTGERMFQLSKKEHAKGSLDTTDRRLCRMSIIPELEETFSEAIHFYMLDNEEEVKIALHQLDALFSMEF